MKVEIPIIRRCCGWLPLRRGIIIFGYLNLIITLFFGILHFILWQIYFRGMSLRFSMYRGTVLETHIMFSLALHVLDTAFNIVLIIGAHKKNSKLMRIYCYYQITTMIANFFALLVTYHDFYKLNGWAGLAVLTEIATAFLGFVIQIYLLLLIYNELNKQRYQEGTSHFTNRIAEVYVEPPMMQDRRSLL